MEPRGKKRSHLSSREEEFQAEGTEGEGVSEMRFSCSMSGAWRAQEGAMLVGPERGMRVRSQRSWVASALKSFSRLMGSREPFVAFPNRDEGSLLLTWLYFLPSSLHPRQYLAKLPNDGAGAVLSRASLGLTGWPADAWERFT